jgi:uncharacterized protein (TIGR00255 family)
MTGYGRGAAERSGRRATVEIRSVNHRFLDIKLRGAALDPAVEEQITARLRDIVERGAVTVAIHVERRGPAASVRIDPAAARAAHAALAQLAADLGTAPPSLDLVVAQPGVIVAADDEDDTGTSEAVLAAADEALTGLTAMRALEGSHLGQDLGERLDVLSATFGELGALASAAPDEARRRLADRLSRLLDGDAVDPGRLAQEVAVLADKMDITEEIVRARSHVEQLRALIAPIGADGGGAAPSGPAPARARASTQSERTAGRAVGRRLDFLVQELGRELNTMGSKSSSIEIVRRVVAAKAELEKVREQVQNVE